MFDPRKFLELAEKLWSGETDIDDEAKRRTILNRAYYAVFLSLRELFFSGPRKRHEEIYAEIKRRDRVIAKKFDKLWMHRIAADYYLRLPSNVSGFANVFYRRVDCDEQSVNNLIELARRFFEEYITKLANP